MARKIGATNGKLYALLSSIVAWAAISPWQDGVPAAPPVFLLSRLASFAVAPLVVDLILGEDRERAGLLPIHLWAPAVAMGIGVAAHLAIRWGTSLQASEQEVHVAAAFFTAAYFGLLVVAL